MTRSGGPKNVSVTLTVRGFWFSIELLGRRGLNTFFIKAHFLRKPSIVLSCQERKNVSSLKL